MALPVQACCWPERLALRCWQPVRPVLLALQLG